MPNEKDFQELSPFLNKEIVERECNLYLNKKALYIQDAKEVLFKKTGKGTEKSRSYYIYFKNEYLPMKAIARMAALKEGYNNDNPSSIGIAKILEKLEFDIQHSATKNYHKLDSDKKSLVDKRYYSIVSRPGQAKFRKEIFEIYKSKCIFSGCKVNEAIEAAHILPYSDYQNDDENNGIPLRRDIHRLYDLNLIAICPDTHLLHLSKSIHVNYSALSNKKIKLKKYDYFDKLNKRWKMFKS